MADDAELSDWFRRWEEQQDWLEYLVPRLWGNSCCISVNRSVPCRNRHPLRSDSLMSEFDHCFNPIPWRNHHADAIG